MKATEVIQAYDQGRRDFRGESLRGCNFKKQNLSGADLSGCDLRGANFSRANLTGVRFEGSKAGLRKRWVLILLFSILFFILGSSVFILMASYGISLIFDGTILLDQIGGNLKNAKTAGIITGSFLSISFSFVCYIIYRKNIITGALILTIFAMFIFPFFLVIFASGALAIAAVVIFTLAISFAFIIAGNIAVFYVLALSISFNLFLLNFLPGAVFIAKIVSLFLSLFLGLISWLTLKQEHRDPWLRKIIIAFAALGGTSFFQANLTAADFTGATLKNTNFNQAILNRTIFKQAIKLELARPGQTLLAKSQVRELLINPSTGAGQNFSKANLRGANLDGANLQKADLSFADLSQASFKYANLQEANLTEVNAVNADLSNARLTASCIENWNIDATTKLNNIDCQYVYLLNNKQERRPSSGEFQSGEFTKLFEEVFDTVDLIFRDGMDWKALIHSLKEVQVQNEDTPLQVQAIENKGDGVFVVKVKVPPDANKAKIHQELTEVYQLQAQLTAQNDQLQYLREQNTNLMAIIKVQAQNQTKIEISSNSHYGILSLIKRHLLILSRNNDA